MQWGAAPAGRPMRTAVNPGRRPVIGRPVPGRPPFTHRIRPRRRPRNLSEPSTCGFSPSEIRHPRSGAVARALCCPGSRLVAARMALRHMRGTSRSRECTRPRFVHSVGTTLWTKTSTGPADVPPHPVERVVGEGGQARGRVWTGSHPPVHDEGRRREQCSSVHSPSPGSRRVLDSSSTGQQRPHLREHGMSPDSTSVKTRNELRTHGMGSPPTSGSRPLLERQTARLRSRPADRFTRRLLLAYCRAGAAGSRAGRVFAQREATRKAAPSEVPRRT
jgi:hypothetical protein